MIRLSLLLLTLLAIAPVIHAGTPQISVGPLFDYLPANSSHLLKRIRNIGEDTAYVRVEISQMHFDGHGKMLETPVDAATFAHGVDGAEGVIASPSRLIIAANGQQATRLVYRGDRTVERYFRLRFIPVVPTRDEFSLSEEEAREVAGLKSAIHVFTGYGTILFVPPSNARYDTRIEEGRVRNQGNATLVLDNLRYCEQDRPDSCTPGVLAHVRPGNTYELDIGPTQFARFDLLEGDAKRRVEARR